MGGIVVVDSVVLVATGPVEEVGASLVAVVVGSP